MMRILLLTSTAGWGGSATSYAKLLRGLRERGHEVHLAGIPSDLTRRLLAGGHPVTELPAGPAGPRRAWGVVRLLRRTAAQVVVADMPRDVRLAAQATLLHPARIVYRYNVAGRRRGLSRLDGLCLRRVAACIYQSAYVRGQAEARAPVLTRTPWFHVPNGYDAARFAPDPCGGAAFRARHGLAPSSAVVLTSASLTRDKGHRVAITALGRVRREAGEITYLVCGAGPREDELRDLALAHDVPTVFAGAIGPGEMAAALSAADIVIHPSLHEIFPNAVGEAMACGRPVVAADGGGTAELVGRDGSAGILVPPRDATALADAVAGLLRDPARRAWLGGAARARIQVEFPLSRMIDGYQAALARVAGDEPGSPALASPSQPLATS
jgi:glycosyltransferase involved in cell wall biosynthesis